MSEIRSTGIRKPLEKSASDSDEFPRPGDGEPLSLAEELADSTVATYAAEGPSSWSLVDLAQTFGAGNSTGRMISFREGDPINEPALVAMFRQIIANNRAGGWRKLKREGATSRS